MQDSLKIGELARALQELQGPLQEEQQGEQLQSCSAGSAPEAAAVAAGCAPAGVSGAPQQVAKVHQEAGRAAKEAWDDTGRSKFIVALCTSAVPAACQIGGGGGLPLPLVRLLKIPQDCTYNKLLWLLAGSLPPELRGCSTNPPPARITFCLPFSSLSQPQQAQQASAVEVWDDQGVQLVLRAAAAAQQHPGGKHLQIYCEWCQEQQGLIPGEREEEVAFQAGRPKITASTGWSGSNCSINGGSSSGSAGRSGFMGVMGPACSPPTGGSSEPQPSKVDTTKQSTLHTAPSLVVIPPSELELYVSLSSSSAIFGHVFEGAWRDRRVAVRCLDWLQLAGRQYGDAAGQQAFLGSTAPLAALRHPHLVEVLGVALGSNYGGRGMHGPAVVMEWAGRDLFAALADKDSPLLRSGQQCLMVVRGVADAMAHLHSRGVVHFLLTPSAVLLGGGSGGTGSLQPEERRGLVVKVGGYELPSAKLNLLTDSRVAFHPDVLPWLAPEMLKGTASITEKVDCYSFGILLWWLWCRRPPHDCVRLPILADSMHPPPRGSGIVIRPIIPARNDPALPQPVPGWRRLMEMCWAEDPQARPSFQAIIKELEALAEP